jgi:hypothetical protein
MHYFALLLGTASTRAVDPAAPTVTDGPSSRAQRSAGGYYVFEAENLDDAPELARQIPAAQYGASRSGRWPRFTRSRRCTGRTG